jgi:hypothetical protein
VRIADSGMRTYFYQRRVKGSGVERNVSLGWHGDPVLPFIFALRRAAAVIRAMLQCRGPGGDAAQIDVLT